MKILSKAVVLKTTNCGGSDEHFIDTLFVVEPSDVGRMVEHVGGFRRPSKRIKIDDVGGLMLQTTQGTHYVCNDFVPKRYELDRIVQRIS